MIKKLIFFMVSVAMVESFGGFAYSAEADSNDRLTACQVSGVYDGDTAKVLCGLNLYRVRLHCIDAPEMSQAPWGAQSRDGLRAAALGLTVDLDPKGTDRYGRTIGVLWVGGLNLNLEQVKAGRAVTYPKYCRENAYFAAEEKAKDGRLGVWSQDGLQQTPWEYRRAHRR